MTTEITAWHLQQIQNYRSDRPAYQAYSETLSRILQAAAKVSAPLAVIQTRAKTISSFAEKALRKRHKYVDPVHQLTDLCGARVITTTIGEMQALARFISTNLIVDEKNSLDVGTQLHANEFGYRSVHFIVQLPNEPVLGVEIPPEIGDRKAEIQLRTFLQHSWAELAHDRVYKAEMKVPEALQRGVARVAALLEEADTAIGEVVDRLGAFAGSYGAWVDEATRKNEIETLRLVLDNEPVAENKPKIALRIARLEKAAHDWRALADTLEPYAALEMAAIRHELGNALCKLHCDAPTSAAYQRGQALLGEAVALDENDAEAYASLAESWQEVKLAEHKVRDNFHKAYEANPADPYHLAAFVVYELFCEGSEALVTALVPAMRAAVSTCRAHADAGIELPWAFFTMGKLQLLLGEADAAAAAYCKGLHLLSGASNAATVLKAELDVLRRLDHVRTALPGGGAEELYPIIGLENLLRVGAVALAGASPGSLRETARATYDADRLALVMAGGWDRWSATQLAERSGGLKQALAGFAGLVFCAGTTDGVSGLLGQIPSSSTSDQRAFELIGYHPALLPAELSLDRDNYQLVELTGGRREMHATVQIWLDLIASGMPPINVRVLALGGHAHAAFDLRLALALGAKVGVVQGCGGSAEALIDEADWRAADGLLSLPDDPMSLRAFINPGRSQLDERLEAAAQLVHARYVAHNWHKLTDESAHPWPELKEHLKDSNRAQATYIEEILRTCGYGVRERPKDEIELYTFSKDEEVAVERMAEMEHGRWNVERLGAGWRPGPRDPAAKITPYLVPWKDLADEIREYDRQAVRAFPEVLQEAGLEVYTLPADNTEHHE